VLAEKRFGAGKLPFNFSKELLAAMNFPLTSPPLLGYIVRG
jgi:hypothetical protein